VISDRGSTSIYSDGHCEIPLTLAVFGESQETLDKLETVFERNERNCKKSRT